MTGELFSYLRVQALISAVLNLFIGGFIASLIYHRADLVPTDALNIAIDITITCLLTFLITAPFCRSSLRRDQTGGVLDAKTRATRLLSRLFAVPFYLYIALKCLFCAAMGAYVTVLVLFAGMLKPE